MPEGPEAKHLAATIHAACASKTLRNVDLLRGRYVNHGPPVGFAAFVRALPLKLEKVDTKGKVIFFHFSKGWYMISKLGMSGLWYVDDAIPTWRADFKSVEFDFGGGRVLTYSDPRSYGTLVFTNTYEDITDELVKLGPDIMSPRTTWPMFVTRVNDLRARGVGTGAVAGAELEAVLSDQKQLVCGIGNYLKSEIMYAARISPRRHITDITQAEWHALFTHAKRITAKMLRALRSNKADAYEAQMQVYQKKTDPQGHPVETYSNKAGRTVHWVPAVQH